MRAVFLDAPERIGVRDALAPPACPTDGVLLRVRACGICGGDLKPYRHHDGPFPQFMRGHEYAGEVVEVGAEATGFRPGDAVVRCFGDFCGLCTHCRLGSPNFCTGVPRLANAGGGFAELLAARAPAQGSGLFHKPPELSFAHAAVCEPADCAVGAALRGRPEPG
jgi:L-iditol 2-dehydrogenase